MGSEPYWYFVKYKPNLDQVLQELRDREFQAGRYNPATPYLRFPIDPAKPGPVRSTIPSKKRWKIPTPTALARSSTFKRLAMIPIFVSPLRSQKTSSKISTAPRIPRAR